MLLSVRDLAIGLDLPDGRRAAVVDGVSFDLERGETTALVGESGCGKTVTALALLGLLARGVMSVDAGTVALDGESVAPAAVRLARGLGRRAAMVFQEPRTALNPTLSVGRQLTDVVRTLPGRTATEAREFAIDWLDRVGLRDAPARFGDHPHRFSGGELQRVLIAMALCRSPDLLVADEPTSALDVTVERQILALLDELRRAHGLGVLFVTHDLRVVRRIAQRVVVLYAGRSVESGSVDDVLSRPLHPYTRGLIAAAPDLGPDALQPRPLPGHVPGVEALPPGCRFHDRCRFVEPACRESVPPLVEVAPAHRVACHPVREGRALTVLPERRW